MVRASRGAEIKNLFIRLMWKLHIVYTARYGVYTESNIQVQASHVKYRKIKISNIFG